MDRRFVSVVVLALLSLLSLLSLGSCVLAAAPGYHVVKKTTLGGEGGWDYAVIGGAPPRLYITRSAAVMVVDPATHKLLGTVPETGGVHGVALDPHSARAFVTVAQDNAVTWFNRKTLKPGGTVQVGQRPDAIVYEPVSRRVFSMNGGSNDATGINAKTGAVVGTVALGGRPEFVVADGKGTVFVNIEDRSEIVAFDAATLKVKRRWSLAPGEGPSGLAMDRAHRRLFSVCSNGRMIVSDADTGKVVATPAIGNGPDGAAFDEKTSLAFSSNGADGTLTVIREDAPDRYTVVETVPTQAGARTMALDPRTHHVFTVTAAPDTTPSPASGGRRRYKAGTFTLIELAPR